MPKRPKVIVPPAPSAPKPLAHADSPTLAASSVEYAVAVPASLAAAIESVPRCKVDGSPLSGERCPVCGTTK